jgi:hypothetical protein
VAAEGHAGVDAADQGAGSGGGEEEELIGRAVEKRRREFGTARACARRALADLGRVPAPIVRGEKGAPVWLDGVVGSITHCAGYRGAAVAEARDVRALGIDAEPHGKLPDGGPGGDRQAGGAVRAPLDERGSVLGPPAVQREGDRLQGVVPAGPYVAGL